MVCKLANSQAVMRVYRPIEHFSRRLVIPSIRQTRFAQAMLVMLGDG